MSLFTIQNLQETKNTFVSRTDTKNGCYFKKKSFQNSTQAGAKNHQPNKKNTWLVGGGFTPFDQYQSN